MRYFTSKLERSSLIVFTAAFHGDTDAFKNNLVSLGAKQVEFSSTPPIDIMDSFSQPLYTHLTEELDAIVNLSRFSTPENPTKIAAIALRGRKQAVMLDFALKCMPCFMPNMETFESEDSMWHGFPPVNAPVKFIIMRASPLWRRSVWGFSTCGGDGARKQLAV